MAEKCYCKWCGASFSSVRSLAGASCSRNPNGNRHELYEGAEKSQYTCKHCGQKFSSIMSLTGASCSRNSNGKRHEPAL